MLLRHVETHRLLNTDQSIFRCIIVTVRPLKRLFLDNVLSEQPEEIVVPKVAMFSEEWRHEFDAGTPGCDKQGTDVYVWRVAGLGSNINSE